MDEKADRTEPAGVPWGHRWVFAVDLAGTEFPYRLAEPLVARIGPTGMVWLPESAAPVWDEVAAVIYASWPALELSAFWAADVWRRAQKPALAEVGRVLPGIEELHDPLLKRLRALLDGSPEPEIRVKQYSPLGHTGPWVPWWCGLPRVSRSSSDSMARTLMVRLVRALRRRRYAECARAVRALEVELGLAEPNCTELFFDPRLVHWVRR